MGKVVRYCTVRPFQITPFIVSIEIVFFITIAKLSSTS